MKKFVLLLCFISLFIQTFAQRTITGVVSSKTDNTPIPGASVWVRGKSNVVITNPKGEYSIPVAYNDEKLIFSFIGYIRQIVDIKTDSVINIALREDAKLVQRLDIGEIVYVSNRSFNITLLGSSQALPFGVGFSYKKFEPNFQTETSFRTDFKKNYYFIIRNETGNTLSKEQHYIITWYEYYRISHHHQLYSINTLATNFKYVIRYDKSYVCGLSLRSFYTDKNEHFVGFHLGYSKKNSINLSYWSPTDYSFSFGSYLRIKLKKERRFPIAIKYEKIKDIEIISCAITIFRKIKYDVHL